MQFHKVLIVGLGQLGLPVAKYVNERGFDTYGYDISTKAMERAEKISVVEKISREAKKNGALVSIESTIPKGTSKKVFEMLSHRLHVVHAPHIDGML